ncbi:hypothetical protein IWZ03DRAFT_63561 [Phyllosticta citriasiana]|uniref:Uncharacterized protein n=1 Tax=Phyllosticta citriasiana TaxID=595635 RepID=A0ABR1KBL4_9PEZI
MSNFFTHQSRKQRCFFVSPLLFWVQCMQRFTTSPRSRGEKEREFSSVSEGTGTIKSIATKRYATHDAGRLRVVVALWGGDGFGRKRRRAGAVSVWDELMGGWKVGRVDGWTTIARAYSTYNQATHFLVQQRDKRRKILGIRQELLVHDHSDQHHHLPSHFAPPFFVMIVPSTSTFPPSRLSMTRAEPVSRCLSLNRIPFGWMDGVERRLFSVWWRDFFGFVLACPCCVFCISRPVGPRFTLLCRIYRVCRVGSGPGLD